MENDVSEVDQQPARIRSSFDVVWSDTKLAGLLLHPLAQCRHLSLAQRSADDEIIGQIGSTSNVKQDNVLSLRLGNPFGNLPGQSQRVQQQPPDSRCPGGPSGRVAGGASRSVPLDYSTIRWTHDLASSPNDRYTESNARVVMKVISITPRGFCYGVVDAVEVAKRVAADPNTPRPIYILGQLVHNRHMVERLTQYGIISLDNTSSRLDLLESIDRGTVIFTAHGVSPVVKARARDKGLTCVDTTCPDVEKTHVLIRRLVADGYDVLYIGRRGHPEPEGAIGEAPDHVHLVQDAEDLDRLVLPQSEKVAVTTQTTLSRWDTEALIEKIKEKFPNVEVHTEICQATQLRQEAAVRQSGEADAVFVVGDVHSSNSNRLVDVVRDQAHRPVYLIDSVRDIRPEMLEGVQTVGVTAGSSTPSDITREVIRFLQAYEPATANAPPESSS